MLNPDAQASIDRHRQEQLDRIEGRRPLIDSRLGARTIGDMSLIEPGAVIWARTDGDLADVRIGHDGEARGGVVLEITDVRDVDDDGEIHLRRAFRCINHYAGVDDYRARSLLTEAQVDLEALEPFRIDTVRGLYRRMARWIAGQRGAASRTEVDLAQDIGRLAAIVGQRLP